MMKNRPHPQYSASEDAASILGRCAPSDFDGHTEFRSLSPEQRLDALGQLIAIVSELKGKAASSSPSMSRKS
jgi:hypothetical protein